MNFIQEFSKKEIILKIHAKPNSKIQKIQNFAEEDAFLSVMLYSKAIKNKANKELIEFFKKKFRINSNQIQIISGIKSQTKLIKISFLKQISLLDLINKLKE
jgi:uncharacterized protein (TIGR00251 family)